MTAPPLPAPLATIAVVPEPLPSGVAETPFDAVALDLARRLLAQATPAWYRSARAFIEGDHWQDAEAWVGPHPKDGETGAEAALDEIHKGFVSKNAIAEICARHRDGVVGEEPVWGFTPRRAIPEGEEPTPEEEALIDEVEAALTAWWDEKEGHEVFQRWVYTMLWATRATLRLYVPRGLLTDEEAEGYGGEPEIVKTVKAATLEEALALIYPEDPRPEDSTVYVDPDSKRKLGIVSYQRFVDFLPAGVPVFELSYLDADGKTVTRIVDGNAAKEEGTVPVTQQAALDYGGRIPVWEATRPRFVTEQILELQKALDLALSMMPRNIVTGGFLERVLLNAQMPGEWITDAETGEKRFKPGEFLTGPNTTNFVVGVVQKQTEGREDIATPSVQYRQPVDVTPAINAARAFYQDIHEEADQSHVLIAGDATASGKSRQQALMEYGRSLRPTRTRANRAGRWFLETTLAMAEAFMGAPGRYTSQLRATFECRLDTGPVDPAIQQQNVTNASKGFLSRETAMQWNGVQDSDAELARINSEPDAELDLVTRRATAMVAIATAMRGMTEAEIQAAAELAGFDEEEVQLLVDAAEAAQQAAADAAVTAAKEAAARAQATPGSNGGQPGDAGAGGTTDRAAANVASANGQQPPAPTGQQGGQ